MSKNVLYTNGVMAVREKYLINDKIFKLCDLSAEEAFRALLESGFGKNAEGVSVYDYEKLVAADEEDIDAFIREYAPSVAEEEYLLTPYDFHNAKAGVKARFVKDMGNMFAPDGMLPLKDITGCIESEDFTPLYKELAECTKEACELFKEGKATGAEIGMIFEKGLYKRLSSISSRNGVLKKLLTAKADMTNILTAMRSDSEESAEKSYLDGGKLSADDLKNLFSEDGEKILKHFKKTPYFGFVKKCLDDKEKNLPLTSAEKVCESFEAEFFSAKKYELERTQPFLYYVFRRRVENANVRILMACLLAGMKEGEIKNRMRTY